MTMSGSAPSSFDAHSQIPMPRACMHDRVVHGEVVQRGLLAGDDDVHVVAAPQAMVHDGEERVRVRRQVDADDLGLLVHDVVDEAGILVGEAVVILAPDVRREEIVEGRDGAPPRNPAVTFSHFACWLNIESTMWMNAS